MNFKLPPSVLRFRSVILITLPILLLIWAFFTFIQPKLQEARIARARVEPLRLRIATAEATIAEGVDDTGIVDVLPEFRRLTPPPASVQDLLEQVSELLAEDVSEERVRNLVIDAGGAVQPADPGTTPVSTDPDPRFALFPDRVSHTPVTVTFESSHARLGEFLWDLRDLPVLIEIRSLRVLPTETRGYVEARIEIFAYHRA